MSYQRTKPLNPKLSQEVIEALGGTTLVASVCSVSTPAVSQWKKTGIPSAQIRFLREKFKRVPVMKSEEIKNF